MRTYLNEGNFVRIQQSVKIRPGDVENLCRLLRGEQGIIRNQRDRLTILQMLKNFPQHCVYLYRNILCNTIRSNQLKMIDWLSVNKESAKYMADVLGSFWSWLKSAHGRRHPSLSWRILSGHDD